MKATQSPLERFSEQVRPFVFHGPGVDEAAHDELWGLLRDGLPGLDGVPGGGSAAEIAECLSARGIKVRETLAAYYREQRRALAVRCLQARHSFEVLYAHARLMDALHRVAYEVSLEEFPLLLRMRVIEAEKELAFRREQLPRKRDKLKHLLEHDPAGQGGEQVDAAERAYYAQFASDLRVDIGRFERSIAELEAAVPPLAAYAFRREEVGRRIVLFARGGYGRAELSFGSDLDTGYCLDPRGLGAGEIAVYKEFVMRIEGLLNDAGLQTVHQYFEVDEDLSRFAEPETLHTIPSILESRTLAGNDALLRELQGRFRAVLPYERFVRRKSEEFAAQPVPALTEMDLKEDFGGLRSVQIPLWLLGVTYRSSSFFTVDLLHLAQEKNLLSVWEASRLLLAVEFLYELRNFVAAAEEFYYDREARESGFYVHAFNANRIDDALARLYLFRKKRFGSMDAFDTFRLRLAHEVQKISRLLVDRVLNRTISTRLGTLQVSVHLGQKRIIAINPPSGKGEPDMAALFPDGHTLLRLFGYIAASDYDLSTGLEDALASVVTGFRLPEDETGRREQAGQLSVLVGAPYAHRALAAMFEINDPLAPGMETLIGRFIPAYNQAVFLLRNNHQRSAPLHEYLLESVAAGQRGLDWLKGQYPELHTLLAAEDVLALKWSLFLHGLGRLAGEGASSAQVAEQAVEVLGSLGYREQELERRVRLLIEHHRTLVALSRTATYMDQALAQYFEIAERRIDNAVLLFLINQAVLQAEGVDGGEVVSLRRLFDMANQILAEMRGFPRQDKSLELINVYFDHKKQDLMDETRLNLLAQKALAQGIRPAVFEPLERLRPADWERMHPRSAELETLQRAIVLGGQSGGEQARQHGRLLQLLRSLLSQEALRELTREEDGVFTWFFYGFPNRYLLASLPWQLAGQMAKFAHFRSAQVVADVVSGDQLGSEGLLIHTRNLERSHTRVAYAMSRLRLNIISGKVNRVDLGEAEHGYCYYFQISALEPGGRLSPRDLELLVATDNPPEIRFPRPTQAFAARGVRVEFCGNDGKGYRVVAQDGGFVRKGADFHHIRVVLRDEPFLFYKVSRTFDLFETEIQQSLITTTGNQVVDYFYLTPKDYERLRTSNFEEAFINVVNSDLLSMAR